jgi:Protein of unknown function (DUF559)
MTCFRLYMEGREHKPQKSPRPRSVLELTCAECQAPASLTGSNASRARKVGYGYCSNECAKIAGARKMAPQHAAHMAKHAKGLHSERMRTRNPMSNPEVKARAMASAKLTGPTLGATRGGNGQPMPEPQRLLSEALGWPTEVVVSTRPVPPVMAGVPMPSCYKIDIASEECRVAVEVDGGSHRSKERQEQDRKKTAFLEACGWTVLRFSNREVMENTAACAQVVWSTISRLKEPTPTSQEA